MYVWNEGKMPEELDSTEKLFEKHSSKPYNPKLANTFFKSGMNIQTEAESKKNFAEESRDDSCKYARLAGQNDFDSF